MNRSAGKVVLVTGGGSGIGPATALAFAAAGTRVVAADRRQAEGEESVALIQMAGGEGLIVTTDVRREEEIERLVRRTVERFDRLDVAFNNAGLGQVPNPLTEVTAGVFDEILAVNVRGVAFGMKHEIAAMLQSGRCAMAIDLRRQQTRGGRPSQNRRGGSRRQAHPRQRGLPCGH